MVLETVMPLFLWIGIFCFCLNLAITSVVALGLRRMTRLANIPIFQHEKTPRMSVIIPALNEAATIGPALRSVLALEYKNLEVIVVNDRSTDATGAILNLLAKEFPALMGFRVDELPNDWLGKNHALQFGADRASGDYLLFTDADVMLEYSTLSRAMGHVLQNGLDHLSVFFKNTGGGGLLNALFLEVGGGLLLFFKPWLAKNRKSRRYMGVGAFNLVKTSAYRAIDGHNKIAMHPIDDVMLGKLIKSNGFKQDCLIGGNFVTVPWYGTVREFINGLMKNTFAVFEYKLYRVAIAVSFLFLLCILPTWALLFSSGMPRLFFLAAICIRLLSFIDGLGQNGLSPWNAVWSLVTPYITGYIVIKAAALTIRNDGILWRGTRYPLEKLKRYLVYGNRK